MIAIPQQFCVSIVCDLSVPGHFLRPHSRPRIVRLPPISRSGRIVCHVLAQQQMTIPPSLQQGGQETVDNIFQTAMLLWGQL